MTRVALIAMVIGLVACGSPRAAGSATESSSPAAASEGRGVPASPSPPAPSPLPSAPPTVDPPLPGVTGWVRFVNNLGRFTYSVPAQWQALSCEDNGDGYVVADPAHLPCGTREYEDAWLFVVSAPGDQRAQVSYRGKLKSQSSVVVDGVPGVRYVSSAGSDSGLAPPTGSEVILYVFFTGNRTYSFEYQHWPSMDNRSADFDRSIQSYLTFSA